MYCLRACNNNMLLYLLLIIQLLRVSIVVASHSPLSESSSLGSPISMVRLSHNDECQALLEFESIPTIKQHYRHYGCERPYPKTHSWRVINDTNSCCQWDGVTCDPSSGHVTELDLSCSLLAGSLPSNNTLFRLRHLRHLNLAFNNFNSSLIPSDIGRLSALTYLNLSTSGFQGQVPKEIGWLSRLTTLDLSSNPGDFPMTMPNFKTITANLTNLRELDLSQVSINSTIPPIIANLSNMESLQLTHCDLRGHFLLTSIMDMPNLRVLHMGYNSALQVAFSTSKVMHWRSPFESLEFNNCTFTSQLPDSIGESSSNFSLRSIDISECGLYGSIPNWIWNVAEIVDASYNILFGSLPMSMVNTTTLVEFSNNKITGDIPAWVFTLPSLKSLYLDHNLLTGIAQSAISANSSVLLHFRASNNQLKGQIPKAIFELHNLQELDLEWNNLTGIIPLSKLHKLQGLGTIRLSNNKLSVMDDLGDDSTSFWPILFELGLSSCNLGYFPSFLREQHHLTILDLSHNGICGLVPEWFLNISTSSLFLLKLSHNSLTGGLEHLPWQNAIIIDISFNLLEGNLPNPPKVAIYFQASHNLFTGEIPSAFCYNSSSLILDLSYNKLTGNIPDCLDRVSTLDLTQNRLEGVIPSVIFEDCLELTTLSLSGNLLEGPIPQSLTKCNQLQLLDVGNNKLNDTFPHWLNVLPDLQILILGKNNLHGTLQTTSNMTKTFLQLRILDISNNDFTGELPRGLLMSFKAMIEKNTNSELGELEIFDAFFEDSINAWVKGLIQNFPKIFDGLVLLDASGNKLEGHIPEAIGDLILLRSLRLANNKFTGSIPPSLGNLSQLESLDLSFNRLDGQIPSELVNLNSLAFFNVSENNLIGPVPSTKQFATFLDNSYLGNSRVCGELLTKKCGKNDKPGKGDKPAEVIGFKSSSFYEWEIILMGLGCGLFLGCVWGYFIFWGSNYYWVERLIFNIEVFVMLNRRRRHYKRRN